MQCMPARESNLRNTLHLQLDLQNSGSDYALSVQNEQVQCFEI